MARINPLSPEYLFTPCDINSLSFETTNDLEELKEISGQDRALEALRFGIGIQSDGYNLFVMGPSGMGKHTVLRQYLEQVSENEPAPDDWCYINNFQRPYQPLVMRLPAGQAKKLYREIEELVDDLRTAMPTAFESDQYRARLDEIDEEVNEQREKVLDDLAKEAEQHNIRLMRTTSGFSFAPLKDGEVVKPSEYRSLSEDEQKRFEQIIEVLQEKLERLIRQVHRWHKIAKEKVRELNREVAISAVGMLIDDVKQNYQDMSSVLSYLDAMQQDVIEHASDFLAEQSSEQAKALIFRYQINVMVDNQDCRGKPVIYEDNPFYDLLMGRIEHIAQMGTLITDFSLIKAGALHKANGGYLILDIAKLLAEPFAWRSLKRALSSHESRIQPLGQILSVISTASLEPEPIPLDLKVILVGERQLFYLLMEYDPEFQELFKVAVDFENSTQRNESNLPKYVRLLATISKREKLKPLERSAVQRLVEFSSRLAGDAEKISNHLLSVTDLMREADYCAAQVQRKTVSRDDVQQAIDGQIRRSDRIRSEIYEEIKCGTILIDVVGEKVGQVNALSVIDLGTFEFAQPFRITATARLGHGSVVDIEREVELGGAIHSKGVLILANFLGQRYARDQPLSVDASLVFEQSYGGVEGDSASVGELCALLSVLADVPIKQNYSITGSVNQLGLVQPIGGVNEKIEGFFDICQQFGLTGDQAVIIPSSNVRHLMLRADVVEAARTGQFSVFAVDNIDDAIELLTGLDAGVLDDKGEYPGDTVNGRVAGRLTQLNKIKQEFGESEKEGEESSN